MDNQSLSNQQLTQVPNTRGIFKIIYVKLFVFFRSPGITVISDSNTVTDECNLRQFPL